MGTSATPPTARRGGRRKTKKAGDAAAAEAKRLRRARAKSIHDKKIRDAHEARKAAKARRDCQIARVNKSRAENAAKVTSRKATRNPFRDHAAKKPRSRWNPVKHAKKLYGKSTRRGRPQKSIWPEDE